MDIIKYYIPIIDDCLCINMSKQNFFDACIPFFNMETFDAFLLFKDQDDSLTSINTPNSFVIKNKCLKESDSKGYIINFNYSVSDFNCKGVTVQRKDFLKGICFDEKDPKFKLDSTIREINKFLIDNINYELNFSGKIIPFYYFTLNSYDIFNLFISSNYTLAKNYFIIENGLKRFVSISDNINIFNLSIFTYKYIDIFNIFHDVFQWKQSLKFGSNKEKLKKTNDKREYLINKLDTIFLPIQDFVIAIWNLYKFRKFITSMGAYDVNSVFIPSILPHLVEYCKKKSDKNDCNGDEKCLWNNDTCGIKNPKSLKDKYLNSKVSECEFLCESKGENFWDTEEYKNSPFNRPGKGPKVYSFKDMLWELASEILTLSDSLDELSSSVNISEYKYIFLIQMLSFRLLKKKFLSGSWGFLYDKYISILDPYRQPDKKYNLDPELFLNNKYPLIYEFNKVQFMGKTYGNCMENTILQFFKLLLWNTDIRNIDVSIINKIIRPQYRNQMKSFLEHIDKEREQEYLKRWVKFISYDVNNDKTNIDAEYKFVDEGKDENGTPVPIEIDSTFTNLYIAMIKVFNIDNISQSSGEVTHQNREDTINDFLSDNELFINNIEVENEDNKDIIKIYTTSKQYIMELIHDTHAYFIEAEDDDTKYVIPYHFSDYTVSLWKNLEAEIKPEFYKNFFQYALLKMMFTEHKYNDKLFTNYKNINEETLNSIYFKLFQNSKRIYASNPIYKNEILFEYIYQCLPQIIYDKNFIKTTKTSEDFWIKIAKNKQALVEFTDRDLWSYIIDNIFIDDFWNEVSKNKDILDIFISLNLWEKIINRGGFKYMERNYFWNNVAKYPYILDYFSYKNLWGEILYTVNSQDFWTKVSKHPDILYEFKRQNLWKKLIWSGVKKSKKDLWTKIGKYSDILDQFTRQNLWREIIISINIEDFWYEISKHSNTIREFTDKKLWQDLITYRSEYNKFWDILSENKTVIDYFITSGLDYNKIQSSKFKTQIQIRKFKPFISII